MVLILPYVITVGYRILKWLICIPLRLCCGKKSTRMSIRDPAIKKERAEFIKSLPENVQKAMKSIPNEGWKYRSINKR